MTKRPGRAIKADTGPAETPTDQPTNGAGMPTDETLDSYDAHMRAQHEHYARVSGQIQRTGTWPTATPTDGADTSGVAA